MKLDLRLDYAKFRNGLTALQAKQLPYATRRALNATARAVKAELTAELPSIFAKVTPFTARSIGAVGPRSASDALVAQVFVLDIQAHYLGREELGGTRTPADNTRKSARALVLPGPALPLDAYRNIPAGTLARLRAQAKRDQSRRRALAAALSRQKKTGGALAERHQSFLAEQQSGAGSVVFLTGPQVPAKFVHAGGYFLRGPSHTLRRLTGFEPATHYAPKFGFRARFLTHAGTHFTARLTEALAQALKTAFQ